MNSNFKKILKIVSLSIFFIFIIVYAFFRSKDLIFGVKIRDINIINGTKIENPVIEVTGNAKRAIKVTLNGREISIDQAGNFKEDIALLSGYNVINIKAIDKFGYSDEKNYQLIH